MSLKNFLIFVEIKTKLASIFPFIIGTFFAYYRYDVFYFANFLVMFVSMICFDMATTGINNYMDFKKAENIQYKNEENIIGVGGIKVWQAQFIIFALIFVATIFGIFLAFKTSYLVLIIGILCFFVGIFYTFGPIPISRMPLGEVVSGFFMGFIITFLAIYIHAYDQGIAGIMFYNFNITLSINAIEIFVIFLISIPLMATIANIMLANNICDLKTDISNKRYTLVYFIGKDNSLKLYKYLYYSVYLSFLSAILLDILPIYFLLIFITYPIVKNNIKKFLASQEKSSTFIFSIKNLVIINFSYIILFVVVIILGI